MRHPTVVGLHPKCTPTHVGFIPTFLDEDDPRPAAEQFQERYVHGGWRNQSGFKEGNVRYSLHYPGDPPLYPIAAMKLRDETIMVYDYAYVAIWQKDGTFEACRMD